MSVGITTTPRAVGRHVFVDGRSRGARWPRRVGGRGESVKAAPNLAPLAARSSQPTERGNATEGDEAAFAEWMYDQARAPGDLESCSKQGIQKFSFMKGATCPLPPFAARARWRPRGPRASSAPHAPTSTTGGMRKALGSTRRGDGEAVVTGPSPQAPMDAGARAAKPGAQPFARDAEKTRGSRRLSGGLLETHTPGVILRNVFQNPAWYTAYRLPAGNLPGPAGARQFTDDGRRPAASTRQARCSTKRPRRRGDDAMPRSTAASRAFSGG